MSGENGVTKFQGHLAWLQKCFDQKLNNCIPKFWFTFYICEVYRYVNFIDM